MSIRFHKKVREQQVLLINHLFNSVMNSIFSLKENPDQYRLVSKDVNIWCRDTVHSDVLLVLCTRFIMSHERIKLYIMDIQISQFYLHNPVHFRRTWTSAFFPNVHVAHLDLRAFSITIVRFLGKIITLRTNAASQGLLYYQFTS